MLFQPLLQQVVHASQDSTSNLGTIQVKHTDTKTEKGIEGSQFAVETADGNVVDKQVTDENGHAIFTNVSYGEYIVRQLQETEGYLPNEADRKVTVDNSEARTILVETEKIQKPVQERPQSRSAFRNAGYSTFSVPSGYPANPQDALRNSKAEIASDSSYAPAKYSVVAQFTENTKFIPNNVAKRMEQHGKPQRHFWVDGRGEGRNWGWNGENGIGGTYTNVGFYNGRSLDLRFTFSNAKKMSSDWITSRHFVLMFADEIAFSTGGLTHIDVKMEYLYSDTGKPATDMEGSYMTVSDIDFQQAVGFSSEQMSRINRIYFDSNTRVDTWNYNGKTYFGDSINQNVQATEERNMFTALVDGHTFEFDWNVAQKPTATPKAALRLDVYNGTWKIIGTGGNLPIRNEHYFVYQAEKPVRTEPLVPTKRVSDNNEKRVVENTLSNISESFTYDIFHSVPAEYERFYYTSYEIADNIPSGLDIKGVKVFDGQNKDVTGKFTISTANNALKVVAKSAELKKASFYNNTYRIEVKTQISPVANLSKYMSGAQTRIPNEATVSIGMHVNKTSKSNRVHTIVPEIPTPKLTKDVEGKNHIDVAHGKQYNYNLRTEIPSSVAGYNTLTITDKLDERLTIESARLQVNDTVDSNLSRKIQIDNQTNQVQIRFEQADMANIRDKKLNLQITSSIKENAPVSLIGNVGSIQLNNAEAVETSVVTVRPLIDIKVVKKWEDTHPERRPSELTYELRRQVNGQGQWETVGTGVGTKANNYEYTFKNVPKFTESDQEYVYSVVETNTSAIGEYKYVGSKEIEDNVFEITNAQEYANIKVAKQVGNKAPVFQENFSGNSTVNGQAEMAGAQFQLVEESTKDIVETITLDAKGEGNFSNVPKGEYIIRETKAPEGYQLDEKEYRVSVTQVGENANYNYLFFNPKLKDIKVTKEWSGQQEDEVTIDLLADGEKVDTIKLNESNNWTHTFTGLQAVENFDNRKEITYTVEEINPPKGYRVSVRGDETNGYTVTNRYVGEVSLPDTGGLGMAFVLATAGSLTFVGYKKKKD